MSKDEIMERLRSYPHLQAEYEDLAAETDVRSPAIGGTTGGTPTPRDHILNARIERLDELGRMMTDIEKLIEPLKYHRYLSYQIIVEHLLMGRSMRATAAVFNYSERHMARLYKRAIADLMDCIQIQDGTDL